MAAIAAHPQETVLETAAFEVTLEFPLDIPRQLHALCREMGHKGGVAVTIRNSMERPEGIDTGSILLMGFDADIIIQSVATVTDYRKKGKVPPYRLTIRTKTFLNV